jgi:glutamine amidotransferase
LRLPHMGWNTLHSISEHPLMRGFSVTDYVYFVHSFAVAPGPHALALCHYGSDFAAVIAKDNVAGAQFHPERSGKTGARLLQNFLEWQL